MDEKLIEKYKEYANTEEAFAVLFVKKYLHASKGKWVDILDSRPDEYDKYSKLEFEFVDCELFNRKIKPIYPPKPKYPPKSPFLDEEKYKRQCNIIDEQYIIRCRAITWEAAHRDIWQQRAEGIKGLHFQLNGDWHKNKSKSKSDSKSGAGTESKLIYKFRSVKYIKN